MSSSGDDAEESPMALRNPSPRNIGSSTPHLTRTFRRSFSLPRSTDHHDSDPSVEQNNSISNVVASERDRFYPSFLGPHAARNRPRANEEEVRNVASQVLVSHSRSTQKPSFIFYLVIFTACYAFYLQNKVWRLEAENIKLGRWSNDIDVGENNIEALQINELVSSLLSVGDTDSITIAIYTVVFTLVSILLYKYLPKGTKSYDYEEGVPFLKKKVAYMVDVCFSAHPYAKLFVLFFATIFLIGFGGLALHAVSDVSLAEALWLSWTFVADSGNHADRVGTGPRIVSVCISSVGILIFATMVGLVSDAITEKLDSLRKGKSEVIEKNHILILGWSGKLVSLLKHLAMANRSQGGCVIVVLAKRNKEEMEMDIAELKFDFMKMGTSVIFRSGSPLILADLKKVSVSKARVIIVLATDGNADQSDARALRLVVSLTGIKEGLRGHVVVEINDLRDATIVELVGGKRVETVVAHEMIACLMIQCALQPGLAQVWEAILGFENCELCIRRWPQLDGWRFRDVLIAFPDAVPCGIKIATTDGGNIILNPDDNYLLTEGDEILVIAEDDDKYAPGPLPKVSGGLCLTLVAESPGNPKRILFCGWSRGICELIMALEAFLEPGSELWVFNEIPEKERGKKLIDGGFRSSRLANIKLVHCEGNAIIVEHLEILPLETFDFILILADESVEDSVVKSDSRSIATLHLIRDILSKRPLDKDRESTSDKPRIITEILDSRIRNQLSAVRISDYVLSNELVSMALAMVADKMQNISVIEELLSEKGNLMYIRPAKFYLKDQEELCFYDIMIRGRQRKEIVIGYRLANDYHAIINPPDKSEQRKWSLDCDFVVISRGSESGKGERN